MIKKIDPKEPLKTDLTRYESKYYLSLLGQSRLSAVEVMRGKGKGYRILERLIQGGDVKTCDISSP
jgi:sugar-specific transcriptional regulator TrmB